MKLITKEILTALEANRKTEAANGGTGVCKPPLKLFTPWGACTWLIGELDEDGDTMFGLCDLGMGSPELGSVSLSELMSVTGPAGLKVERDKFFEPEMTLSEYADKAREDGHIKA